MGHLDLFKYVTCTACVASTPDCNFKVVGGAKGFLWGTLVLVMYLSDHNSN